MYVDFVLFLSFSYLPYHFYFLHQTKSGPSPRRVIDDRKSPEYTGLDLGTYQEKRKALDKERSQEYNYMMSKVCSCVNLNLFMP